jgi:hypothetical protein
MNRATVSTTTMISSRPTAAEVTRPTRRVDAMTRTACRIIATTVMTLAVVWSSGMPSRGMSAVFASALSTATTPITR